MVCGGFKRASPPRNRRSSGTRDGDFNPMLGSASTGPGRNGFVASAREGTHPSPRSYSANGREVRGLGTTGPHRIIGGHGGSGWRLERDQSFSPPYGISYRGVK